MRWSRVTWEHPLWTRMCTLTLIGCLTFTPHSLRAGISKSFQVGFSVFFITWKQTQQECIPVRYIPPALYRPGGLCPGVSLFRCVSVRESLSRGLCPGGSLSRGVSDQGTSVQGISVQGGLCPGGLCPGESLSRCVSVRGSLSRGSLFRGLRPGGFWSGGLCPGDLCPGRSLSRGYLFWGSLSRGLCSGVSVHGISVKGEGLCPGGVSDQGSLSRGSLSREVSVQGEGVSVRETPPPCEQTHLWNYYLAPNFVCGQ